MYTDTQFHHLFELIPDPRLFRRWCIRSGVSSLTDFVNRDLSDAPDPWYQPWSQFQTALLEADVATRVHGITRGCAVLDRLLRRPPAMVRADIEVLQRLLPLQAQQPARRRSSISAREALELLGGVAGARAVATRLSEGTEQPVTVRQVRDRFRNTGGRVRKLGAGYFATEQFQGVPVLHWVESRIEQLGPIKFDLLVDEILDAYPHGDRRAVRAWLHQHPGVLCVRGEHVMIVDSRMSLVRSA